MTELVTIKTLGKMLWQIWIVARQPKMDTTPLAEEPVEKELDVSYPGSPSSPLDTYELLSKSGKNLLY